MSNIVNLHGDKRWRAVIEYESANGPIVVEHFLEEIADLHGIIEYGPDWNTLTRCTVTLNRHDGGEEQNGKEKAVQQNEGDIAERLIQAAEIAIFSGGRVGPSHARSLNLGYAHSWADMNGWGKERLEEEERLLRERMARQPTPQQVSEAEEAMSWLALVDEEHNRAALSAWVWAMANPRLHFKDCCFEKAGIHPETGRRRKDRALACISHKLARKAFQHNENADFEVLPEDPEIEDIEPNIAKAAAKAKGIRSWTADDAFNSFLINPNSVRDRVEVDEAGFSWAQKRNERRRQREAKKRKQEAV